MAIEHSTVQHPRVENVQYKVPTADVPRWEAQGWVTLPGRVAAPADPTRAEYTLAQLEQLRAILNAEAGAKAEADADAEGGDEPPEDAGPDADEPVDW